MSCINDTGEIRRIEEEKRIEWEIRDFSSLCKDKGFYYKSSPFDFDNDSWYLCIYPGGDAAANGEFISLYLEKNIESPCNVTFTIGIKKTDGKLIGERTGTHDFKNDNLRIENFFQQSELFQQKYKLLARDILTIVCKMKLAAGQGIAVTDHFQRLLGEFCNQRQGVDAFSQTKKYEEKKGKFCNKRSMKRKKEKSEELKGYNLCQDFKNMLLNGQDHDLTLKVRDKEIRAHRNILRSRSDVFDSMLRYEMVEKISGVIDVPDCDPQAFEQFLVYLYSGEVETLDQNNMLGLYYVADKYNVTLLKEECREFIKQSVSFTNICDIIQLSLNHSDSILLECATGYFVNNVKDILPTVEWQHFVKNYPIQANELFIKSTSKWYDSKV